MEGFPLNQIDWSCSHFDTRWFVIFIRRQSTLEATSFLYLIQIATDPTNADRLQPYDPTLYPSLLSHLNYHTYLYHNIHQYLNSLDDKSLPTVATAISIVLNLLRYAQSSVDTNLQSFVVQSLIRYILAISALPNRISIDSLTQVSVKLPFDEVVTKIVDMAERQDGGLVVEGDVVGIAGLLGNVLAFGHKRVNKMSQEGLVSIEPAFLFFFFLIIMRMLICDLLRTFCSNSLLNQLLLFRYPISASFRSFSSASPVPSSTNKTLLPPTTLIPSTTMTPRMMTMSA